MMQKQKIKKLDILFVSLLVFGVAVIYCPTVYFSVNIFDDSSYIGRLFVPDLSKLDMCNYVFAPVLKLHSPIVMFSFWVDRIIWGHANLPFGVHFGNIFYHATGTALLYFLCRKLIIPLHGSGGMFKLRLSPAWSAFAAALWAFHPQRVESVAWISERKDLLLSLMFFGILLVFVNSCKRKNFSFLAFILFVLSLAVKPMLLTIPAILWGWLTIKSGRYWGKNHIVQCLPYACICVLMVAFYFFLRDIQPFPANYGTCFLRLKIIFWNLGNYFFSAVLPVHLMPFYPFYSPAHYSLVPGFVFPGILLALFWIGKNRPAVKYCLVPCLLLFPLTLLPVCGIVRIGNADWADRYNILPSVFLILAAVFVLRYFYAVNKKLQTLMLAGSFFYIGFLIFNTVIYLPCWKTLSSVKFACVTQVKNPNYRIMFLHAMTALLRNELKDAALIAGEIREDAVCTPFDKKAVRVFRAGMNGLLQSLGNAPDTGGKTLTSMILSDDIRYMVIVSDDFLDLTARAAAYWNIHKNNISTAIKLYTRAAEYTTTPFSREIMLTKAALLKKDPAEAEKFLMVLEKHIPDYIEVKKMRAQVNALENNK